MEEFQTYEYVVAPKKSGKYQLKRLLLMLSYVLYVVVLLAVGLIVKLIVPLLALIPLSLWIIVFFTWRYVSVEHEYSIVSGEMTVADIYGGRSRKDLVVFRLKECAMIAPAHERQWQERAELFGAEKVYSALSSPDAPDAYFAAFENEKGAKCIVYFEATERALRICRFYNPSATVMTQVSR